MYNDGMKICSVEGCDDNKIFGRGWCSKHYQRWRKFGDPEVTDHAPTGEPLAWLKGIVASPPDGCAIWPYSVRTTGYGQVVYKGKCCNAHRLALILFTGEAPDQLEAAHGPCHNRLCVNPLHLSWKTRAENIADKLRDGTHNQGERCPSSKLTESRVISIYHDDRRHADIAKDHGIAASTVSRIKLGTDWNWLTKELAVG